MKLVFIEGPGKKETISKYLGSDYLVFPTKGHVRDLPVKSYAIDKKNLKFLDLSLQYKSGLARLVKQKIRQL